MTSDLPPGTTALTCYKCLVGYTVWTPRLFWWPAHCPTCGAERWLTRESGAPKTRKSKPPNRTKVGR